MKNPDLHAGVSSWIDQHPEVESLRGFIFDINGVMRGKRLPVEQLEKLCAGAMRLPLSTANVDIWGRDIAGSPWVFETGDSDGKCAWTGRGPLLAPWLKKPAGMVPLVLHNPDDTPFEGDARNALARLLDRFAAHGLRPVTAFELEFYLADPKAMDGKAQNPLSGADVVHVGVLSVDELNDFDAILNEIYEACRLQGVGADTATSESGIGQFEVTLNHSDDALKVADDAMLFKTIAKGVARKYGLAASFMAKPFGGRPGSGLHLHASILGRDGKNIFDDGGDAGSDALRHAVAGVLAAMPESMLIFAPHLNSYRRLRPEQHAPTISCWGYDNRTVAVRIPSSPPAQRRIEHRVAGADTNAYLVMLAVLGAALTGIEEKMMPGDPIIGSAYDAALGPDAHLPTSWQAAHASFAAGRLIKGILPETLHDMMIRTKAQEIGRFATTVTPFEYQSYLDQV
ncbi:MAG: glutamine synthetase family protein [Alphaproteobacteria bacterium]